MAKRKLFDSLNENFFNVLSCPNKDVYVECLFLIYDLLDNIELSFQGERELVVQVLMNYFEDRDGKIKDDETINEGQTPRQRAVGVINYLKECGWVGEEELGDYKTSINLFDYSIMIIDVLKSITTGKQFEYSGEIYVVYTLLKNFELKDGVGIIEQAKAQTQKITRRLRALKANIYRYYYNITKNKKQDELAKILDTLLNEYKQNFFDKAYYNLKTKDSLPRYKGEIISSINKIYNDEITMTKLTEQVMEEKGIENYDDAYYYLESHIREIRDSFNAFDKLISDIDTRNEQYISASAAKILFLTNRSDDIEGIINKILDIILKDEIDDSIYPKLFNLISARNIDTESLYTQREYKIDTSPDELFIGDDFISDELMKEKLTALFKHNIFGKKEINKYVIKMLEVNDEISAENVSLETTEDLVKLVLIYLYSRSIGMSYTCELENREVKNNFLTFNNFIIKSRRKKQ